MTLWKKQRAVSILIVVSLFIASCGGLPKGIEPVGSFDVERYLGTWYEIARLDHRFERGMSNVSAEYALKDDGGIRVVNRGYKDGEQQWSEAVGKARFARSDNEGYLKVSFFGPFYGSYVVFELDENYQHAYIAGNDRDYLWFLSRTPRVSQSQLEAFTERAEQLGFAVQDLIFVDQSRSQATSQ